MEARRILVVEDDPACQKVALAMIGRLGYTVDIANSADAAVKAAASYRYALIFLECHLRNGDGFAVAERIQAQGESSSAPIVALTIMDNAAACRRAGMVGHLRKPVRMVEIQHVIKEWLT